MAFIDMNGNYYEGDMADVRDLEVPARPTPYHAFNKKLKQWVLDEEKVMILKKQVLTRLDDELRTKTLLLNLSEDEKKFVKKSYDEKVAQLATCNDPIKLQEFKL